MELKIGDILIVIYVDKDKCNGCEMCVAICPKSVFVMNEGKAEVEDAARCNACCSCVEVCPTFAIYVDACE